MQIAGRRIHIAGSAGLDTPIELLRYAHALVASLTRTLAMEGASFVLGAGKEPLVRIEDPSPPAIIFDWTALASLQEFVQRGESTSTGRQGRLVAVVATEKTNRHIPESRRSVWDALCQADAVQLEFVEPGWTSGAVRRTRQAQLGDILIALSGGEGTEHLAQLYLAAGKPVIPLDLNIGSSTNDGSGGAAHLEREARTNPERFFRVADAGAAGMLVAHLATNQGTTPVDQVVDAIRHLLGALEPPSAFYVRLLDASSPDYPSVERYFRHVVDPVVTRLGYTRVEMGHSATTHAWLNQAIFDNLHYSAVAVVDLTGLRNNCFMELGYALGHGQRVILLAREGTDPPFDAKPITRHIWPESNDDDQQIASLEAHWARNIDRPPLVKPRGLS